MRRHIALLVPLATASAAAAEPQPLDGRQLKELVAGSSVTIDAPMGYKLPIRHGEDGALAGDAGGLAFYLGSKTDTGRWRVKGDRLCYKWDRWFSGEERCMKVSAEGNRIHWTKDDGDTGTGTVVARAEPKPVEPAPSEAKVGEAKVAAATKPVEPAVAAQVASRAPAAAPPPSARGATSPAATRAAARPAPTAPVAAAAVAPATASQAPASPARLAAEPPVVVAAVAEPRPAAQKPAQKPMRVGGPPPPPEPAFRVVSVEPNDVLNIRIGPSSEHLAVGAIPPDARGVRLVGSCVTEWCPVRHRGIVGWVHRYYLAEDPAVR